MKYVVVHLCALLLSGGISVAQETAEKLSPPQLDTYMESGMEVEGIRAPYYDDKGNLQAQLYGEHARVMDNHVAEITNLRIDVYREGKVAMTLFAPHCFSRVEDSKKTPGKKTALVYSDGDVLLEMEELSIVGRGFTFSSESNRFEILDDSRVLVRKSVRDLKGAEL